MVFDPDRVGSFRDKLRNVLSSFLLPVLLLLSFSHARAEDISPADVLCLDDCIAIALSSSPDVVAAQERIEQARAAVEQAQSGFYPRLSLGGSFVRSNYAPLVFSNKLAQGNLSGDFPTPPPPGFDPFAQFNDPAPLNNWNTRILLEWPLFQGGRTYYGNRAATARLDATETNLRTVHSDLAFSVSAAYYEILRSENSIGIAEESIRQMRSHLDIAQARFENGTALRSDVLQVSVRLAEAEESLEIARHNLERAKSRLNLAMGRPVSANLQVAHDEQATELPLGTDETLEDLTGTARGLRPELQSMNQAIATLRDSVKVAKAGHYPQIDAFAHYDVDTEDFSESKDSWTVGVGAKWPIFDGFLTRSAVSTAEARLREAEAREDRLMLDIDMEVKNAYLAKSEATRRFDVLRDSVYEAEETLRIVSERYAEGLTLVTELIDAEAALTNSRLHLLSARHDYDIAAAALDRAVGRILEEGSYR